MADSYPNRLNPTMELFLGDEKCISKSTKNANRQKSLRLNDIQFFSHNSPRDTFSLFHNPVLSSLQFQNKQKSNSNSNNFSNVDSNETTGIYNHKKKLAAIDSKYHLKNKRLRLNNISLHVFNNDNSVNNKGKRMRQEKPLLYNDNEFINIKKITKFLNCLYYSPNNKVSNINHLTSKKITDVSRGSLKGMKDNCLGNKKLPLLYINSSKKIRLNNSNTITINNNKNVRPVKKIYSLLDIKRVSLDLNA